MTDLSIFYRISDRWGDLMKATTDLQRLKAPINLVHQDLAYMSKRHNTVKDKILKGLIKIVGLKIKM